MNDLVAVPDVLPTEIGLQLGDELSFEDWEALGHRLIQADKYIRWHIGDWLNFGEAKYGEKYAQAIEVTGLSYDSLNACKQLASRFEISRRRLNLPWGHHAEVRALTLEQQDKLLDEAESENYSQKDLREAVREHKRQNRFDVVTEIAKGNVELSSVGQTYPLVYTDPPWRYEHSISDSRKIENQYPTMSLEEICGLDIDSVASKNCILFMWTTSPKLQDSFEVLSAWGFDYITCAVWNKQKIGMGYYFRQQHELLLVARRGDIPTPPTKSRISSVLNYPRSNHSSKPHEVYEVIEAMYPELEKLEMFCRTPRDGWSVWGNQSYEA